MNRPKFRKLYFPGLISLVFLPVMCICYFISNNTFHKYHVMTIAWAPKEMMNKWISRPDKKGDIETFRKYKVLNITGNSQNDIKELSNLKALLNQLNIKNDTVNGLKVSVGSHAQYGEVVSALDILFQDKDEHLSFDPIGNEIFILHVAPQKRKVDLPKDRMLYYDLVYPVNPTPVNAIFSFAKIRSVLIETYKALCQIWPSVLILILMLWFTAFKKRRYLNLRNFHLFGG